MSDNAKTLPDPRIVPVRLRRYGNISYSWIDYCTEKRGTLVRRNSYGTETEIGARGLTYIAGVSREEFATQCRRYNVEFILPNAPDELPQGRGERG